MLLLVVTMAARADPLVVVTVSDLKPIVEDICGGYCNVASLLEPNEDPHHFSLSSSDLKLLKKAELIVLANSELLGFESKIKSEFDNVIDFDDYGVILKDYPGYAANPHGYWLYPQNALAIAKAVARKLSEIHPTNADGFERNYQKFEHRVIAAADEAAKIASGVRGEKFVAMVPGVCYIASTFNAEVAAVLLSEGAGFVSGKTLEEVKTKLRSGEYAGIIVPEFMKGSKGGELAEQLARDTGCRIAYVRFSAGDLSYDSLLIFNAAQLAHAKKVCPSSNPALLYALSAICMAEAALLFYMRVRL